MLTKKDILKYSKVTIIDTRGNKETLTTKQNLIHRTSTEIYIMMPKNFMPLNIKYPTKNNQNNFKIENNKIVYEISNLKIIFED